MLKKDALRLQPSEAHVFRAAATIYSAWIAAGRVGDGEEKQWIERSVEQAIQMAHRAEGRVQSDDELG